MNIGTLFPALIAAAMLQSAAGGALTPAAERHETVEFASGGRPRLVIVADGSETAAAAAELRDGLGRITGGEFTVTAVRPETGGWIEIVSDAEMPPEAFRIDGGDGGGGLRLTGGPDGGPLNAVLALLEEDLGCRWYGRNLDLYPAAPDLTAAIAVRSDAPAFRRRNPFTWLSYDRDFCRRNRILYDDGFGYLRGWFCHTYENIFPRSAFGDHPEVFMIGADGARDSRQLCPSHPEVRRRAVEKVLAALRADSDPRRTLVGMSQNDYTVWCLCPQCRESIARHGGSPAAPHLELVNHVARSIAPEFPEIRLVTLGYHHTQTAPSGIAPEPNVRLWFCTTDTDNASGILRPARASAALTRNLGEWRNLVAEIETWDYMVDFRNYFMPYPSFGIIADNLRFFRDAGCLGAMVQGMRESPGGDRLELRAWVFAKLLWNPDRDLGELVRDFNRGVYGAAAPRLDEYFDLVEVAGNAGKRLYEFYTPAEFIARAGAIFDRARSALAEAGQQELMPRLDLAMLPAATLEIDRMIAERETFDAGRFAALLDFVERVAAANGVGTSRENVPMAKYLNDCRILLGNLSGDRTVRISAAELTLYRDIGAGVFDDPLAETGRAARQACNDSWSLQWRIPSASLLPGTRYRVRALLRTSKAGSDANCWMAGVHDNTAQKTLFSTFISGGQLRADRYTWVEIGTFLPPEDGYFFGAAAQTPGNAGEVWLEKIELIPAE